MHDLAMNFWKYTYSAKHEGNINLLSFQNVDDSKQTRLFYIRRLFFYLTKPLILSIYFKVGGKAIFTFLTVYFYQLPKRKKKELRNWRKEKCTYKYKVS
jgi:hypothetical protein